MLAVPSKICLQQLESAARGINGYAARFVFFLLAPEKHHATDVLLISDALPVNLQQIQNQQSRLDQNLKKEKMWKRNRR